MYRTNIACRPAGIFRGPMVVSMRPMTPAQAIQAIQTGLDFGRRRFSPAAFRMTIATFNQRAQRVAGALGFGKAGCFQGSADGRSYVVLVRQEAR